MTQFNISHQHIAGILRGIGPPQCPRRHRQSTHGPGIFKLVRTVMDTRSMVIRHPRPVSDLIPRARILTVFTRALRYMMGSSLVLAASRSAFAFARDGTLPLSKLLYRINPYTGTPVNTVWFDCALALLVGLLALLGPGAISAVFTLAVTASYVEIITPIVSRFVFDNNFKPGPFSLGVWVSASPTYACRTRADTCVISGCPRRRDRRHLYALHARHALLPRHAAPARRHDELHVRRPRRGHVPRDGVVLFPDVRRRALVPRADVQPRCAGQGERGDRGGVSWGLRRRRIGAGEEDDRE